MAQALLLLVCLVATSFALPSGAASCTTPGTCMIEDPASPVFGLTGPSSYHPGETIDITISTGHSSFAGFLLYGQNTAGTRLGTWTLEADIQYKVCNGAAAASITHKSPMLDMSRTFKYTSPTTLTGNLVFHGVGVLQGSLWTEFPTLTIPQAAAQPPPQAPPVAPPPQAPPPPVAAPTVPPIPGGGQVPPPPVQVPTATVAPVTQQPRPISPLPANAIQIKATSLYPQGIAWDRFEKLFITGSLTYGSVNYVDGEGDVSSFLPKKLNLKTIGVHVDENDILYVCYVDTTPVQGAVKSVISAYDLSTPEYKTLWSVDLSNVPAQNPTRKVCWDLCTDPEGNLYATDACAGAIWKISRDGSVPTNAWSNSASYLPTDDTYGLTGMAYHPDGYLLVAHYGNGHIMKVPIHADGSAGPPITLVGVSLTKPLGVTLITPTKALISDDTGVCTISSFGWEAIAGSPSPSYHPAYPSPSTAYDADNNQAYVLVAERYAGGTSNNFYIIPLSNDEIPGLYDGTPDKSSNDKSWIAAVIILLLIIAAAIAAAIWYSRQKKNEVESP